MPFFTGTVSAKYMQNTLHDVALGNIEGALPAEQGAIHKPQEQHEARRAEKRVQGTDDLSTASGRPVVVDDQCFPEPGARNIPVPKE
ncbi:hypothetical protein HPB52_006229 [Rhipicephalus sanguineus]|uniref:Uncharacterized protein n=1 Tax=Rhipicephalus sanguineus TaxID=34632 RepID=A0A9D4PI05_RHISA|nr:hypothetical protein HPB52_006229 [Rhipicephalus sanguineus]